MSQFRGIMASDLISLNADLNDQHHCAMALLFSGWRAVHVDAWLDDAMKLARVFATAQDRESIKKDMAHSGDALPVVTGCLPNPNLPEASASGLLEAL